MTSVGCRMMNAAGGQIALNRRWCDGLSREISAQFVVGVASEPGAQILIGFARGQVLAKQASHGFGNLGGWRAVADRARDAGVLADRSAKAEVISIDKLPLMLDFFAFDPNVGDPVLAAAVGAPGDVQTKLLVELRNALLEFVNEPASEALGFGDGQLAEFGSGAGHSAAPK